MPAISFTNFSWGGNHETPKNPSSSNTKAEDIKTQSAKKEKTEKIEEIQTSYLPIMMGGIAGTALIGGGAYYFWPKKEAVKQGWFS